MAIRKNVAKLTATERNSFVDALKKLKAAPSKFTPPTSSRYDDFVYVHMQAMLIISIKDATKPVANGNWDMVSDMRMPMWAHRCPAFFPWHRELLYQFEKDLQQVLGNPNLGLPYWDWSIDQSTTAVPWLPDFMGGDGKDGPVTDGPFAGNGRWPLNLSEDGMDHLVRGFGLANGFSRLPTPAEVNATLAQSAYDGQPWNDTKTLSTYRNQTEGWYVPSGSNVVVGMHNLVHVWVGGNLGTMLPSTSPNDPVFFLHHCNVDRLWAVWRQRNPSLNPYLPTTSIPSDPGQGLNEPMIFYDNNLSSTPPWSDPPASPSKVVDHHGLGYQYDYEVGTQEELKNALFITSSKQRKNMQARDRFKVHLEDLIEGNPLDTESKKSTHTQGISNLNDEEWIGYSPNFSFEEALKDALRKAPKNLPTDYYKYTVEETGYEEGGFAKVHNLFVKIKRV
jgi:tyrosinase